MRERAEPGAGQGAGSQRRREKAARRAACKACDGAERPEGQQQDEGQWRQAANEQRLREVLSIAERLGERDRNEPEAKKDRGGATIRSQWVGRMRSAQAIARTNATDQRPTMGEAATAQR